MRRGEHIGRVALQLFDQGLHLCPDALHNGRLRESQDMIDRDDLRRGRRRWSTSEMRRKRGQERCALPLMAVVQFYAQQGSSVNLAGERCSEFGWEQNTRLSGTHCSAFGSKSSILFPELLDLLPLRVGLYKQTRHGLGELSDFLACHVEVLLGLLEFAVIKVVDDLASLHRRAQFILGRLVRNTEHCHFLLHARLELVVDVPIMLRHRIFDLDEPRFETVQLVVQMFEVGVVVVVVVVVVVDVS